MKEIKELTCIVCPMSCHLEVTLEEDKVIDVKGNTCIRGKNYGEKELSNPTRMVTSTIKIENALYKRLPVITSGEVPKKMILSVMAEINRCSVSAPIQVNDVIIKNVCGLDVDIIASRSMDKIK